MKKQFKTVGIIVLIIVLAFVVWMGLDTEVKLSDIYIGSEPMEESSRIPLFNDHD